METAAQGHLKIESANQKLLLHASLFRHKTVQKTNFEQLMEDIINHCKGIHMM